MADYTLDIFSILGRFDENNLDVYSVMTEDAAMQGEFDKNVGWLYVQWMTGAVSDRDHRQLLMRFSDLANSGWDKFAKHPELQSKLLAAVGLGRRVKHKFFKIQRSKAISLVREMLEHRYIGIRAEEVQIWISKNTEDSLVELSGWLGYQQDQIEKLKAEFSMLKEGLQ